MAKRHLAGPPPADDIRIGTEGTTETKKLEEAYEARREQTKLIAEKQKKGYVRVVPGHGCRPTSVRTTTWSSCACCRSASRRGWLHPEMRYCRVGE